MEKKKSIYNYYSVIESLFGWLLNYSVGRLRLQNCFLRRHTGNHFKVEKGLVKTFILDKSVTF